MNAKDDINFPLLAVLCASSAIGLAIIIIGVQAFYLYFTQRDFEAKWGQGPLAEVVAVKDTQRQQIHRTQWVDQANGVAAIPVEQAYDVLVKSGGKVPASRPSK